MGTGLFLIHGYNHNIIKGYVPCTELQTFVKNRKVEERNALVQQLIVSLSQAWPHWG